ncbi:MAG: hypothetical protein V1743_04580, partial [Nanoarchaeota archaeon]
CLIGTVKALVISHLLVPFLTVWKFIQTILVAAEVQEVRKLTAAAIVLIPFIIGGLIIACTHHEWLSNYWHVYSSACKALFT